MGKFGVLGVALYWVGNRRKREILILVVDKEKILEASVPVGEVMGLIRAQDSVDRKRRFSAHARNLCWGFVFLFMGMPWCEWPSWL